MKDRGPRQRYWYTTLIQDEACAQQLEAFRLSNLTPEQVIIFEAALNQLADHKSFKPPLKTIAPQLGNLQPQGLAQLLRDIKSYQDERGLHSKRNDPQAEEGDQHWKGRTHS
jgi:hypothetical protein